VVPAGYSTMAKSYDQQGFLITSTAVTTAAPAPAPTAASDSTTETVAKAAADGKNAGARLSSVGDQMGWLLALAITEVWVFLV